MRVVSFCWDVHLPSLRWWTRWSMCSIQICLDWSRFGRLRAFEPHWDGHFGTHLQQRMHNFQPFLSRTVSGYLGRPQSSGSAPWSREMAEAIQLESSWTILGSWNPCGRRHCLNSLRMTNPKPQSRKQVWRPQVMSCPLSSVWGLRIGTYMRNRQYYWESCWWFLPVEDPDVSWGFWYERWMPPNIKANLQRMASELEHAWTSVGIWGFSQNRAD